MTHKPCSSNLGVPRLPCSMLLKQRFEAHLRIDLRRLRTMSSMSPPLLKTKFRISHGRTLLFLPLSSLRGQGAIDLFPRQIYPPPPISEEKEDKRRNGSRQKSCHGRRWNEPKDCDLFPCPVITKLWQNDRGQKQSYRIYCRPCLTFIPEYLSVQ